ncbi:MAG: hypothetical protein RIQ89_1325 [Bacteroidota bacterium]
MFICTNERGANEKKSCGEACGLSFVKALKKELKDLGLNKEIRVQRAGCLDVCEHGPAAVVYPEGVFYGNLTASGVNKILEQHLINNAVVTDLEIKFDN